MRLKLTDTSTPTSKDRDSPAVYTEFQERLVTKQAVTECPSTTELEW